MQRLFQILKSLLKNVLLGLSLFFGSALLWATIAHGGLAKAPVTPLDQVASLAGTGKHIRVESPIYGDSDLRSRDGQGLALQKVAIEFLERRLIAGRYSSTRRHIYSKIAPNRLWLGQSANRIEVKLPRLWDGDALLLESQSEDAGANGAIPPRVAEMMSPTFNDLPPLRPGYTLLLWSLKQGQAVNVWSQVETQDGRPVLQLKPSDGLISARPFEEMARLSTHSDRGQIAFAVVLLGVPFWILRNRWKARRTRTAAESEVSG